MIKHKKFNYKVIKELACDIVNSNSPESQLTPSDVKEVLKAVALAMQEDMNVFFDMYAYGIQLQKKKMNAKVY